MKSPVYLDKAVYESLKVHLRNRDVNLDDFVTDLIRDYLDPTKRYGRRPVSKKLSREFTEPKNGYWDAYIRPPFWAGRGKNSISEDGDDSSENGSGSMG